MKRVFIADGHSTVRFGLGKLIDATDDVTVVGEADNGEEALCLVEELRPDLVILGLNLRGGKTGIEVCQQIKTLVSPPLVMVYVAYHFAERVAFCLLGEADSYIHKGVGCVELLNAVRCTIAGERVWRLQDSMIEAILPPSNPNNTLLTAKEREILVLLLYGYSNSKIGRELYVTISTVRTHVRSILRKLDAGCRRDLMQSHTSHASNF